MRINYDQIHAPENPINKPTYVIQYFDGDTIESVLVEDCPNVVYAIIQARDDPAHRDYRICLACDQTVPIYPPCDTNSVHEQTYQIQLWEKTDNLFPHDESYEEDPNFPVGYTITQWFATQCRSVLEAIAWARDNHCEIYQVYLTIADTPWLLYGKFPEEYYSITANSSCIYGFVESELEEYLEP